MAQAEKSWYDEVTKKNKPIYSPITATPAPPTQKEAQPAPQPQPTSKPTPAQPVQQPTANVQKVATPAIMENNGNIKSSQTRTVITPESNTNTQNNKEVVTYKSDLSPEEQAKKQAEINNLADEYNQIGGYQNPDSLASLVQIRESAEERKKRLQRENLIWGISDAVNLLIDIIGAASGGNVTPTVNKKHIDKNNQRIQYDEATIAKAQQELDKETAIRKDKYLKGVEKINDRYEKNRPIVKDEASEVQKTTPQKKVTIHTSGSKTPSQTSGSGIRNAKNPVSFNVKDTNGNEHEITLNKANYEKMAGQLNAWLQNNETYPIELNDKPSTLSALKKEKQRSSQRESTQYGMQNSSTSNSTTIEKLDAMDILTRPAILSQLPMEVQRMVYSQYKHAIDGGITLQNMYMNSYFGDSLKTIDGEKRARKIDEFFKKFGEYEIADEGKVKKWSNGWK